MVTDTVGLDIGQTSIKAVRFCRTLTGRESLTCFQKKLRPPLGPSIRANGPQEGEEDVRLRNRELAEQLRQFLKIHRLARSTLVTALPCQDLCVRMVTFPFHDPKKLAQVVPYEVEHLVPFSLDEIALDYAVLPSNQRKALPRQHPASDVVVAATPKSILAHHVHVFTEAGVQPAAIGVDALALYTFAEHLRRRLHGLSADLGVIDIGASKTTLCLIYQGKPWLMRTIPWGGHHVTRALAEQHGCSITEAECRKRQLTAKQLQPLLAPLVQDIRTSLHAYEASTHSRIRHCWFSGGGSEMKELPSYLWRELELDAIHQSPTTSPPCPGAFSVAYGLALSPRSSWWGSSQSSAQARTMINMKRVSATNTLQTKRKRRDLWLAAAGALFVLILALADLSVRVLLKESRAQALTSAVQAEFHKRFPGIVPVMDEREQAQMTLETIKKKLTYLGGDEPQIVPVLADFTRRLPKSVVLKVDALTIDPAALQLEAETNSFESVEKVKQALSAFPGAQEVTVSDAVVGASPDQVVFRVKVTLLP